MVLARKNKNTNKKCFVCPLRPETKNMEAKTTVENSDATIQTRILEELQNNNDINAEERAELFKRLKDDETERQQFFGQVDEDDKLKRTPATNQEVEQYTSYASDQIYYTMYKTLRRYVPYDGSVRTDVIHMPLKIWNELFDRLPKYHGLKRLIGSQPDNRRVIRNYRVFRAIFGMKYPVRVWNDKRCAIPKVPIIIYYYDHKDISGCVCRFGFRVFDEKMDEILEMRSRRAGESVILRNTMKAMKCMTQRGTLE